MLQPLLVVGCSWSAALSMGARSPILYFSALVELQLCRLFVVSRLSMGARSPILYFSALVELLLDCGVAVKPNWSPALCRMTA
jgi:hypothetical protein